MDNDLFGLWAPERNRVGPAAPAEGRPLAARLASTLGPWASNVHNWTRRVKTEEDCKRLESRLRSLDGDLAALEEELRNLAALTTQVKTDLAAIAAAERDVQNVKQGRVKERARQQGALEECRKKLAELQGGR